MANRSGARLRGFRLILEKILKRTPQPAPFYPRNTGVRLLLLVPFAWILSAQQQNTTDPQTQQQAKPARLTGVVLNSLTGEPIRKVQVRLTADTGRNGRGAPPPSAAIATDATGRFTFEGLQPGSYRLGAQKPGFLTTQYGARRGGTRGTPIQLDPGAEKQVEFKILPQGVIAGRVVDEDGDPVANVEVTANRLTQSTRNQGPSPSTQTNDLGEFRLPNLPTGKYYVMANFVGRRFGERLQIAKAATEERDYAPTYFPGSLDTASAAVLEVAPGREVSGIQIPLQKTAVFRVRGKVIVNSGAPQNLSVFLAPKRRGGGMGGMGGGFFGRGMGPGAFSRVRPDGAFEITGVRPGAYNLTATAMDRGPRSMGRSPIEVSGDIDNAVVTISPPISLNGSIKVEGVSETNFTSGRVLIRMTESMGPGDFGSQVGTDGTFKIENLRPEKGIVIPFNFPDNLYLRSVRLANQPVTGELDLSTVANGAALQLTFSQGAATVEGTVKEKDQPAAGIQVSILPDPMDPASAWRIKQATTDPNGAFTITGLAPGDYRVYALTESTPAADLDPEFLKSYITQSAKVTLKENAREHVEPVLIDPDAEKK